MSATSYVTTWTPDAREEWMDQALCAQTDPEMFFPEKGGNTRPPKAVCASCPVCEQCLAYALRENITDGIWGGMSPRERRAIAEPREPGRTTSAIDAEQLQALHARALTGPQIAARLGVSDRSVTRALTQLGLETEEMKRRREARDAKENDMPAPAPDAEPAPENEMADYEIRYTTGQPGDRVPAVVAINTREHGRLEFWTVLEVPA